MPVFITIDSGSAKQSGLRQHVDTMFLFDPDSIGTSGIQVLQTANGSIVTKDTIGMEHLQAVVNIDSKSTMASGARVSTLDFSWIVYLFLMGDAVTRRALKPILLDKPELAAALSAPTWQQKIDVLTDTMSQELNASFGEDAVGKLLRDIVAEAQKPASVSGEAQASAPRLSTRLWPICDRLLS